MSTDPSDIVDDAQDRIDEEDGLGMFIVNVGFGGILMSVIYGSIDTVQAAFQLIYLPIRSFALSLADVVLAAIGGQSDVVLASIQTAVRSFETGAAAYLGPFAPILGIFVIGAMTWLMVQIWRRIPISPLTFISGRLPGS